MASTSATLRRFCLQLIYEHPELDSFAAVNREHVESYKLALAAHVTAKGTPLKVNTLRMRLGMLLSFFDRIIEWGYDDVPSRNPLYVSDIPRPEEPLPKALDDAAAARFLREAAAEPDARSPAPGGGGAAGQNRHAGGRPVCAREGRRVSARRRLLAPGPRRQAPKRPAGAIAAPAA